MSHSASSPGFKEYLTLFILALPGGEYFYDEMGYDGYQGGYADDYYGDYGYDNYGGDYEYGYGGGYGGGRPGPRGRGRGGPPPPPPVGDSHFQFTNAFSNRQVTFWTSRAAS